MGATSLVPLQGHWVGGALLEPRRLGTAPRQAPGEYLTTPPYDQGSAPGSSPYPTRPKEAPVSLSAKGGPQASRKQSQGGGLGHLLSGPPGTGDGGLEEDRRMVEGPRTPSVWFRGRRKSHAPASIPPPAEEQTRAGATAFGAHLRPHSEVLCTNPGGRKTGKARTNGNKHLASETHCPVLLLPKQFMFLIEKCTEVILEVSTKNIFSLFCS